MVAVGKHLHVRIVGRNSAPFVHGWHQLVVFDDPVEVGDKEEGLDAFRPIGAALGLIEVHKGGQVEVGGGLEEGRDFGVREPGRLEFLGRVNL